MFVLLPSIHPFRRKNVEPAWLLHRPKSPRVRQPVARVPPCILSELGILVRTPFGVRVRSGKLVRQMVGRGGFLCGGT